MLQEVGLHAVKGLFYAESAGVVTSGHVTKMAVPPFDHQLPKTPCYTQTSTLYLVISDESKNPRLLLHSEV